MKPVVKSMLLCDYVIMDRDTGKNSAIGIFLNFQLRKIPCTVPAFWVMIQITEIEGLHDLHFRLVSQDHPGGPNVVAEGHIKGTNFALLTQTYTIRFNSGPVLIQTEGRYEVELVCDQELIASQTFMVYLTKAEGETK